MSWRIANECAERRFGSAARKQIIMFLADKASDDGSGIWCSKGTIQRHTELSESTVKRTIIDFLREGILIETGRRHCKNGYTVIYRIVLERVAALEPTAEPDIETGVTVNPVQPEPGTGSTVNGVRGSRWTPNHPKTIHKPPTRKREAAEEVEDLESEKILAAYPEDRIRDRRTSLRLIAAAVKAEVKPDDLKQAVKAYAKESEGLHAQQGLFLGQLVQDAPVGEGACPDAGRSQRRRERPKPKAVRALPNGFTSAILCAAISPTGRSRI